MHVDYLNLSEILSTHQLTEEGNVFVLLAAQVNRVVALIRCTQYCVRIQKSIDLLVLVKFFLHLAFELASNFVVFTQVDVLNVLVVLQCLH